MEALQLLEQTQLGVKILLRCIWVFHPHHRVLGDALLDREHHLLHAVGVEGFADLDSGIRQLALRLRQQRSRVRARTRTLACRRIFGLGGRSERRSLAIGERLELGERGVGHLVLAKPVYNIGT